MTDAKFLSHESLAGLVAELAGSGIRVLAPATSPDGRIDYQAIERLEQATVNAGMPRRSLRGVFQPATETVIAWKRGGDGFQLKSAPPDTRPTVVLGCRPCDAAGPEIMDQVMGWDYRDEFWFARRESTTVISVACAAPGPTCFCGAVGLGPSSNIGSDIVLHPASGGYLVEVVTPKGQAFAEAHSRFITDAPPDAVAEGTATEVLSLPMEAIRQWLEDHFEDTLWNEVALRCLGCGACTSICPTCHCFDLVDEPNGTSAGARRRNWDTCQTAMFTVHASSHNPRPDQSARCRQRIMHKFYIYPTRFERVLCTGCGRCVAACPAGVSVPEILEEIVARAEAAPAGEAV